MQYYTNKKFKQKNDNWPLWLKKANIINPKIKIDSSGRVTLLRGIWLDGIWNGNYWKNGIWIDGIWNGGTWESGYWFNGHITSGYFDRGIINNCKIDSGHFCDVSIKNCIAKDKAVFKNCSILNGIFQNRSIQQEVFNRLKEKLNGLSNDKPPTWFLKSQHENSLYRYKNDRFIYYFGNWHHGEWNGNEFVNGNIDNIIFNSGTIHNCNFKYGHIKSAEITNGIFHDGIFDSCKMFSKHVELKGAFSNPDDIVKITGKKRLIMFKKLIKKYPENAVVQRLIEETLNEKRKRVAN